MALVESNLSFIDRDYVFSDFRLIFRLMAFRILKYDTPNRILLNLLFWLFYFIYPFLRFRYTGEHTITWEEVAFYLALYGGVLYTNNLFLLPKYLENKKFKEYLLILIPALIAIAFFESYVNKTLLKTCECEGPNSTYAIYNFIHLGSLVVMFGSVLVFRNYTAKIQALEHAENERLASELKFLKAQVNPHMLFNSLNSIYAYTIKNSTQAPEMVLKLSEILRYMLYECDKQKVPLQREINYLQDYVALQQMRQSQFKVNFQVQGALEEKQVAPMIFIAFVENAFKHADLEKPEINIAFIMRNESLDFSCENSFNSKALKKTTTLEEPGGLGLSNARKLLDISYPGRYELTINRDSMIYKVNLSLEL